MKWNVQSKSRQGIKELTSASSAAVRVWQTFHSWKVNYRVLAGTTISCLLSVLAAKLCFLLFFSFLVSCLSCPLHQQQVLTFTFPNHAHWFFILFFREARNGQISKTMKWLEDNNARRCAAVSARANIHSICVLCMVPRAPALMTTCWLRSWPPGPASRSKISSKSTRKVEEEKRKHGDLITWTIFIIVLCLIMMFVWVLSLALWFWNNTWFVLSCNTPFLNLKAVGAGNKWPQGSRPITNQLESKLFEIVNCSGLCIQTW